MSNYCVPYAYAKIMGVHPKEIAALVKGIRADTEARGSRPFRKSKSPVVGVVGYEQEEMRAQLGIRVLATVSRPGMLLRTWIENRIRHEDNTPWLVTVTGHIVVYRGGMVYDNARPTGEVFSTHPSANKRVKRALQVELWDDRNPYTIGVAA